MAKQGTPTNNTITTITDLYGNIIVEVRQNEYMVMGNDGSITSYTHYRNIQLVDGSTWNPAMLWAKPPVHIGVCAICRDGLSLFKRRTHGLVAMSRARLCSNCGVLCCPSHRTLLDNRWRCPKCTKNYRLKSILRPLFFQRIED